MNNRFKDLKILSRQWKIEVEGIHNLPNDSFPSIFIANHSCLMDIFYLPASLMKPTISLISARLIYKKIKERQQMVQDYLYALPIEAHGGRNYTNMCLDAAVKMLKEGLSVSIFPEGAYVEDQSVIYRGRTGASRIIFNFRQGGGYVYYIPVAIDVKNENLNLDSFNSNNNIITVKILEPINYETEYEDFLMAKNAIDRNKSLHDVIDKGFQEIASVLRKEYCNQYIELFPKGNVIFSDGNTIPTKEANTVQYLNLYQQQLENYREDLCRKLIKK